MDCLFLDLVVDAIEFGSQLDVDLLLDLKGVLYGLQGLVHPLHRHKALLPTLQEVLLTSQYLLLLQLSLLHDRLSLLGLLLLRDQLGCLDSLRFSQSLNLLVHGVDEEVLLLLLLLQSHDILLAPVDRAPRDCQFALHLDVVLLDLVESSCQFRQLVLCLDVLLTELLHLSLLLVVDVVYVL